MLSRRQISTLTPRPATPSAPAPLRCPTTPRPDVEWALLLPLRLTPQPHLKHRPPMCCKAWSPGMPRVPLLPLALRRHVRDPGAEGLVVASPCHCVENRCCVGVEHMCEVEAVAANRADEHRHAQRHVDPLRLYAIRTSRHGR